MTELESGFSMAEVTGLLRRRSAIVLAGTILGLLAGFLAFATAAPKYSATARVEVAIGNGASTPASQQIDLGTESDKVKSDAVGNAVRKQLTLSETNTALFAPLTVTARDKSRVLGLTYESGSATKARDIVNAIARAYLAEGARVATDKRTVETADLVKKQSEAAAEVSAAQSDYDETEPGTSARVAASDRLQQANQSLRGVSDDLTAARAVDTNVGELVREAPLPSASLSKRALGTGVGLFGLFTMAGGVAALYVDRRDARGGGRRKVEHLVPDANIRLMPTATARNSSPAEIDAAIDRLAVELAGGGSRGRASSVLLAGTRAEPPLAMAEELAASLTFAGIPALFVLAGAAERELNQAHVVLSFTDLISGPSITGPASLPDVAGVTVGTAAPTVTWLRPRGSAESSGLLRRAVVEALITRAGREGFEVVVFVAATPTRNAAAAALGQWVSKTAVIVEGEDSQGVETTVSALNEAAVRVTEVVWT